MIHTSATAHTIDGKYACPSCHQPMYIHPHELRAECHNTKCAASPAPRVELDDVEALEIAQDLSRQAQAMFSEVRSRMQQRALGIDRAAIKREMDAEDRLVARAVEQPAKADAQPPQGTAA